ncbi:MAG: TadE family protein [Paracoccaceae bacterium]
MRLFRSRLFRTLQREDGTASIEFVIFVPIILTIFMASVEAGFYMAKNVLLERGLDIVMRDLRLGKLGSVSHDTLRDLICKASPIINDCKNVLKVEMQPVSTASFLIPTAPATCVDRGNATQPMTTFIAGGSHELMIVRVCVIQDPMFPTTGIGLKLKADAHGGYQMIVASVFANEPR